MKNFEEISRKLQIHFKNIDYLKEALTHSSFINEHKDWPFRSNERLEFLGDAVLEFIVSDYLIKKFPSRQEGELTVIRAALTRTETLLEIARNLHLEKYILLSKGEKHLLSRESSLLADAVEALIGALYLDQGIKAARKFVEKNILGRIEFLLQKSTIKDPKSIFQERSQATVGITPVYRILSSWGPDHAKHFKAGVFWKKDLIATGEGKSKREAEIEAAKRALIKKGWV